MDRIVVTGMGLVSPLGVGVNASWKRLIAGRSGLRLLPEEMVGDLAAKVGGIVPSIDEDPEAGFDVEWLWSFTIPPMISGNARTYPIRQPVIE